jgi:hypothetical protein
VFLFEFVVSLTVIYWVSSTVAEIVINARYERELPVACRLTVGYLVSVVWFAAAFKVMPIQWAWGLGVALLAAFACRISWLSQSLVIASLIKRYLKPYIWCLLLANVLLLPLHMGRTYGPFTEGGGDVSLYADVAKYLVDNNLAAFGMDDLAYDIERFITDPTGGSVDNLESLARFSEIEGNPPTATYQAYRQASLQKYGSILFSTTAQWFFLSGSSNLPVFFAVLGFHYACAIMCIWVLFSRYGRVPATLATLLLCASHGLASVFYNVYLIQGLCLMISGLAIALPSPKSLGALYYKIVALCMTTVLAAYPHFAMIIAPLLLVSPLSRRLLGKDSSAPFRTLTALGDERFSGDDMVPTTHRVLSRAASAVFALFVLVWLFTEATYGFKSFLPLVDALFVRMASILSSGSILDLSEQLRAHLPYLGTSLPIFSTQWLSFLYGLLSQQHFEPLMHEPIAVSTLLPYAVIAGNIFLITSLCVAFYLTWMTRVRWALSRRMRGLVSTSVATWCLCVGVVALHHIVAQSTLYTQAKAAQNVIIVFYVGMLMPFAALYVVAIRSPYGRSFGRGLWGLATIVGVFVVSLIWLRLTYASLIANGMGRSTILERSYYSVAEHIQSRDPDAFVIVEPRTSADTYLGIQPYSELRMLPSRFLSLSKQTNVVIERKWSGVSADFKNLGSDFLQPEDLPHLWLVTANRKDELTTEQLRRVPGDEWVGEQLACVVDPRLLMFGHHVERLPPGSITVNGGNAGSWSPFFFRNGSASIVMPPHGDLQIVEVVLKPASAEQFGQMAEEALFESDRSKYASMVVDSVGSRIEIRFELPPSIDSYIVPLARFWGEFWMIVRVDKEEPVTDMTNPARSTASGDLVVTGDSFRAGNVIKVRWTEISSASGDDWIGLFPVGGEDNTRAAFAFTGGGSEGNLELGIPVGQSPGNYEVRFYKAGRWVMATRSDPLTIGR